MIIKKLYRKCKHKWWNKERMVYESTTITDYIGWFLFGVIPIYLIELDTHVEVDFDETGKSDIRWGINEKYKHLMIKER